MLGSRRNEWLPQAVINSLKSIPFIFHASFRKLLTISFQMNILITNSYGTKLTYDYQTCGDCHARNDYYFSLEGYKYFIHLKMHIVLAVLHP